MSKEAIIFEVSESSFEKYVIANSNKAPVVVAFIAAWSEPCVRLCGLFENLAIEFPEQFVFAKADIDENEELKQQYSIENIPTLKVFIDGQVVRSEEGLLEESDARALLKDFDIYNESEELRLQARTLHIQGATSEAIMMLSRAMKLNPSNVRVAMDMVQVFIDLGEIDQAVDLFNRLPDVDKNSPTGQSLSGQLWIIEQAAKTAGLQSLNESLLADPDNFDARFDCAICEIAEHNYQQALDHLLYIQQHQSEYREGAARELILTIINTISPNNPELAKQYRSQLGAILDI
jgi:putative thioredoxin